MSKVVERVSNAIAITCMVVMILSKVISLSLKPVGSFFEIAFFASLIVLAIVMAIRVCANIKEITNDRWQFLIVHIISLVVLITMIAGLNFNYFENVSAANTMNYVALALYMFSSICLL